MVTTLQTFRLPDTVSGTESDIRLAHNLVRAWQTDGILQVATNPAQGRVTLDAIEASQRFFRLPMQVKARYVSDLTYSGYIASGEEVTAGEADYSEIFTVCEDVAVDDPRVQERWPCHGPVPWPSLAYKRRMQAFMDQLGSIGEKLLRLVALGLDLADIDALTRLTSDGWHHMRVLRFPALSERTSRGIGAHTDYGLLVIAAQDDIASLYTNTRGRSEPVLAVRSSNPKGNFLTGLPHFRLRRRPRLPAPGGFPAWSVREPDRGDIARPASIPAGTRIQRPIPASSRHTDEQHVPGSPDRRRETRRPSETARLARIMRSMDTSAMRNNTCNMTEKGVQLGADSAPP